MRLSVLALRTVLALMSEGARRNLMHTRHKCGLTSGKCGYSFEQVKSGAETLGDVIKREPYNDTE
jgi:hypothetical protein